MKEIIGIAAILVVLLLVVICFGFGRSSVVHDCQHLGRFYEDQKVYECKEQK